MKRIFQKPSGGRAKWLEGATQHKRGWFRHERTHSLLGQRYGQGLKGT